MTLKKKRCVEPIIENEDARQDQIRGFHASNNPQVDTTSRLQV